jgi:hypothetical protein
LAISYNATTRTFDAGTYNGLPIIISVLPKNKSTGQWELTSYFLNVYSNIKITLSSTTSSPQLQRSDAATDTEMKTLPSQIKVNVVKR